jgi:hypothetical protein
MAKEKDELRAALDKAVSNAKLAPPPVDALRASQNAVLQAERQSSLLQARVIELEQKVRT